MGTSLGVRVRLLASGLVCPRQEVKVQRECDQVQD